MRETLNTAHCQCGDTHYAISGEPVIRVICHCDICKEFNDADFADITIYKYADVPLPEKGKVSYKTYTKPPLVMRGKCTNCDKPAVEYIKSPMAPKMVIVPTANIEDQSKVPEVNFHSFYHRRVKDHDDGADKVSGFLRSQAAFMLRYFRSGK